MFFNAVSGLRTGANPADIPLANYRQTMSKDTAINSPLQLAAIYRAGLGAQWNSYRDAAERLSAIYERPVGFARIREAVAVSDLPTEVLSLFVDVGLLNGTARCLLKLARAEGSQVLRERAAAITQEGLTRNELVSLLSTAVRAISRRRWDSSSPLKLAAKYHAGGYGTRKEAAEALRVRRNDIANALAIDALPEEVKALSPDMSTQVGLALVQMSRVLGRAKMRELALEASRAIPRLKEKELVGHFQRLERRVAEVNIRRESGTTVIEYRVPGELGPEDETWMAMYALHLNERSVAKK
jgi:hypothetical protein